MMMKLWGKTLAFIVSMAKLLILLGFILVMSSKLLFADETTQYIADKESQTKENSKLSFDDIGGGDGYNASRRLSWGYLESQHTLPWPKGLSTLK